MKFVCNRRVKRSIRNQKNQSYLTNHFLSLKSKTSNVIATRPYPALGKYFSARVRIKIQKIAYQVFVLSISLSVSSYALPTLALHIATHLFERLIRSKANPQERKFQEYFSLELLLVSRKQESIQSKV